jgi:hypothetical protein
VTETHLRPALSGQQALTATVADVTGLANLLKSVAVQTVSRLSTLQQIKSRLLVLS